MMGRYTISKYREIFLFILLQYWTDYLFLCVIRVTHILLHSSPINYIYQKLESVPPLPPDIAYINVTRLRLLQLVDLVQKQGLL